MHHEFDDPVRCDHEFWPVIQEAAKQLDEESEGTFMPARAKWYFEKRDDGRPVPHPQVRVEVVDETGVTHGQFAFADLVHPRERRHLINWLWGDVLANRSKRLMQRRLAATPGAA